MDVTRQDLIEHYRNVSDEELLARASSGELTSMAQNIADTEIRQRGLKVPPRVADDNDEELIDEKEWVPVTSFMYIKEASIIQDVLVQEGIPTKQAAPNPQRYATLAPELDTVQVLVPRKRLDKARIILKAREAEAEE